MFNFDDNNRTKILSNEDEKNRSELTCPIVFLNKDTVLTNSTPVTESFNMMYKHLDYILGNDIDKCLDVNKKYLHNLSYLSIDNAVFNIVHRIVNDSLKSVFSALEQSYIFKTEILNYINLETIRLSLLNDEYINYLIGRVETFYRTAISKSIDNRMDLFLTVASKEFQIYSSQVAQGIFISIISRINNSIEVSVDRTIDFYMREENFSDDVTLFAKKIIEVFKGIDKNANGHFWLYAKYALSKAIYDEVSLCYNSILDNINNIILNLDILCCASIYTSAIINTSLTDQEKGNQFKKLIENNLKKENKDNLIE